MVFGGTFEGDGDFNQGVTLWSASSCVRTGPGRLLTRDSHAPRALWRSCQVSNCSTEPMSSRVRRPAGCATATTCSPATTEPRDAGLPLEASETGFPWLHTHP